MSFTNPLALLLLVVLVPLFGWIGFPRFHYRRRRDIIALGLRLLIITLLVLSLAGLQIRRQADKLAVVFVIDGSASMDSEAQAAAKAYVSEAIAYMNEQGRGDQAAVVIFGSNALVEHPMDEEIDLPQFGSKVINTNTDLSEAIRLGLALFPADTAKRIVILSDGVQTVGDARRSAQLAEASGVQIDYISFARAPSPEVLIRSLQSPSLVSQGENFDVLLTIESTNPNPIQAKLTLRAGGIELSNYAQQEITIEPGVQILPPITFSSETVGFVDFEALIEPIGADGFEDNNFLSSFTRVVGQQQILVVSPPVENGAVDEGQYLVEALSQEGLLVEQITPAELPLGLPQLSNYSSIVLTNVSATDLIPEQMEILQVYVRDLGGGLVAIGGDDSYAVGGYFQTPLEETLPVEMRIRDEERVPPLSMLFVLDTSGSMEIAGSSGVSNLELAKEAILRSFDFLNNDDKAGVLSFDTQSAWILDLQTLGDDRNRRAMANAVAGLRPGGGTDIFAGVESASKVLPQDDAVLKHMILLTDGGANPLGVAELVERMYANNGITTTVIAVGQDYARWLEDVTRAGRGNFHVAVDVRSIPTIFASETVLATRSYIFEDPFTPIKTANSPIIEGFASVPLLYGYVASTPKDTATVILTGPEDDPILASWQYGLGRSVAFTSDATARWGKDWVSWDAYSEFWKQVISWTITEGKNSNLEVRVEERGEQAVLIVDARDNRGNYLNALELDASVTYPNNRGNQTSLPMRQVAPGRYETLFEPNNEGAYFIRVAGITRSDAPIEASVAETSGWVLSYSAEFSLTQPDEQFLKEISGITGGGELPRLSADQTNIEDIVSRPFIHNLDQEEAPRPMFPYLLTLAAFLLIFDIAVRRLVINKSDLEKLREAFRWRRQHQYEVTETAERMSGLMDAKRRAATVVEVPAAEGIGSPTTGTSIPAHQASPPTASSGVSVTPTSAPKPQRRSQAPVSRPSRHAAPAQGGDENNLASRLLKKKKEDSNDA